MCTWIRCKKCARLYTPLDIVEVPNLIQCSVSTLDDGVDSSRSPKSCIDCRSSVCGSVRRNNSGSLEELMGARSAKFLTTSSRPLTNLIRREGLEEIDRLLEIGDNFLLGNIVGVTASF